ncbi:MAG: MarR family transcriptional regulator [Nanoarchaeota archaeon]|nr:MarR family transcriptional regulator [Nanoarchaeota archaeon]
MIDFACKRFSLEEVIRCGLGLTKADLNLLSFLIKNINYFFTTQDLSKEISLDLSTVQRSVRKLHDKNLLLRKQKNLKNGGYIFYYKAKPRREIKDIILDIVEKWVERVGKELENWA